MECKEQYYWGRYVARACKLLSDRWSWEGITEIQRDYHVIPRRTVANLLPVLAKRGFLNDPQLQSAIRGLQELPEELWIPPNRPLNASESISYAMGLNDGDVLSGSIA